MKVRIRTRPVGPALVILLVIALVSGMGGAALSLRQQHASAATPGPDPYAVTQVVDTNPDPTIVETSITAKDAVVDVGNGLLAHMWTFNGTVPGPQFRLTVGDTVIVHFTNLLPEPTGIHWHGIELANASDGTPLTQNQVPTGGTFLYKFVVTRPGIFWYHPHHHASTNHVFRGLYGSIIVTDNQHHESTLVAKGVLPTAAQTKTLVLSDTTVCAADPDPSTLCSAPIDHKGAPLGAPLAAGEIPNIQVAIPDDVPEGRTVLTNGVNVGGRAGTPTSPGALDAGASKLDVQAGQGLRLQLVNAATMRYFRLVLTDNVGTPITLFRVGGEGGLLDHAVVEGGVIGGYDTHYSPGEILLAPGERADVVAAIPASATGVLTLWTQGYAHNDVGFPVPPTVPMANFNVNGSAPTPYTITDGTPLLTDPSVNAPVEVLPAPTASLLDPATFSPPKPGLASQTIALTNAANDGLGIDTFQGTHELLGDYTNMAHPGSTRYAKIGDVLELTVANETTIPISDHPFHLHGFSIQPLSLTPWPGAGAPVPTASYVFPYREFVDEINIPVKYMLTFRVRIDDRPLMDGVTPGGALGRWVFHCHLFAHATFGMMSELDVVAADGNERPYANVDKTAVAGNQAATLTNTGTWTDPDHDAVTLTASVGAVVKDPNGVVGSWSWSYQPPAGAPPFVYITATDAQGKQDQAVFALAVNASPVVTIGAGQVQSITEGSTLNVAATFADTGADLPYTATIDYGTGAGPQPVVPTITQSSAPAGGALQGAFQYGDNGTFPVTLTVTDAKGATGTASFPVTVVNAVPDGSISGGESVRGVRTFFAHVGQTLDFNGVVTDPGSDDLASAWSFGDLTPAATQVSLVNAPASEPATPSPSVQPRSVTHSAQHTYTSACRFAVVLAATDDDGGASHATASVIVTRRPQPSHGSAYWQRQYGGRGPIDLTATVRQCYLKTVSAVSSVFNEMNNVSTIPLAGRVMSTTATQTDARRLLNREILTSWLNFANGGVDYNEKLDTDGNRTLDAVFNRIMARAETVRLNPSSSTAQLQAQRAMLARINGRDGNK